MNIDTSQHSTNFSPRGSNIEMIVIHSTEGTRSSDIPILLGHTSRRVSAHYYVQRDGKVFQFVPDNQAAWHAGASTWLGHGADWIQKHSIGIEMENLNSGLVNRQSYPEVQFNAAVELTRSLIQKYGIDRSYLVRHKDIAPGRKADPAYFDWAHFQNAVFTGGSKPTTLVASSTPDVVPPETPYETETADWLPNPGEALQKQINTAAETAVSNVFSGLWAKLGDAWRRFLD